MFRSRPLFQFTVTLPLLLLLALPANAGDILRGGSSLNSSRRNPNAGTGAGSPAADAARLNARDRLARTTQAINAVKAMQQAARSSAADGSPRRNPLNPKVTLPRVTDGLGPGGLQLANGVPKNLRKPGRGENAGLWVGAELPEQSRSGDGVTVTIKQQEQQAILNWKRFDVGRKTTLVFDQSKGGDDASQWVAFNKVNDPRGRPSQILGSIKAAGQVYVINQNGIIFGGGSQVNVHTLTASAIPLNESFLTSGLLNNPSAQFLFDYRRQDNLLNGLSNTDPSVTLSTPLDPETNPQVSVSTRSGAVVTTTTLTAGEDYTLTTGKNQITTLTLTAAGTAKAYPNGAATIVEAFTASYGAKTGKILVQRGAQLQSPTTAANVGGRIALFGREVRNQGTIQTPDGQTILGAGLQIGLTAHRSTDPSLRGLDPYVGEILDPTAEAGTRAGRVINAGVIETERGNAYLTGAKVFQNGVIDSSTSVSLNGRVDLVAGFDAVGNSLFSEATSGSQPFVLRSSGLVSLGKNSLIRILPELESASTVIGSELALTSRVEIQAANVHFGRDSILLAPNAQVNVNAGRWLYTPPPIATTAPRSEFLYTAGQIYADRGALIDVSGTPEAFASLDQNILTLQFRGAEFSDAPLQREGGLRATDLTIDIRRSGTYFGREWVGTPLGDATGYAGLIQRTVAQLTTAGGDVTLRAGDSVVLQKDATLDVSGGYVKYEAGYVETTRLLKDGHIVDIANATPDQLYDGIYTTTTTITRPKWGITETYQRPLALSGRKFESAYLSGAAGGSIFVQAPAMALDGQLHGRTVAGPRQVRDDSGKTSLPASSSLRLLFQGQEVVEFGTTIRVLSRSVYRPRITIGESTELVPEVDPFGLDELGDALTLDPSRSRRVTLSPNLVNVNGFGSLAVEGGENRLRITPGTRLEASAGGGFTFTGANLDVGGDLIAPGGTISLTAYAISPYALARNEASIGTTEEVRELPAPTRNAGIITLRPGATLSAAGTLVDDRYSAPASFEVPIQLRGGAISLTARDVILQPGSLADVSGGVTMGSTGMPSYGDAGSISLLAGREPQGRAEFYDEGRLDIGGELRGYSGAKGGSLSLQAMRVRVGGAPEAGAFAIAPAFFDRGGFSRFSLAGIASTPLRADPFATGNEVTPDQAFRSYPDNRFLPGLVIAPGLVLEPTVQSWIAPRSGDLRLETTVLPVGLRPALSLAFEAKGAFNPVINQLSARADIQFGASAVIRAGPEGSVSLKGDAVTVLGSISAPGGSISISGVGSFPLVNREATRARTTVYIGADSRLSVAGQVVTTPNDFGFRTGRVLPGGRIALAGNIVSERGALLDVSGTSGVLDFTPAELGLATPTVPATSGLTQATYVRTMLSQRVDSDGGTLSLAGSRMLFVDSTLLGQAGGPSALGGDLVIRSGRFYGPDEAPVPTDVQLIVRQEGFMLPDFVRARPDSESDASFRERRPLLPADRGTGQVVLRRDGTAIPALGYFSIGQFSRGGFDGLEMAGVVRLSGDVNITAGRALSIAGGSIADDGTASGGGILVVDGRASLRAPYVKLGTTFAAPLRPTAQGLTNVFGGGTPYFFGLGRGEGELIVEADLIDVGNFAVRGVQSTTLAAVGGDIRGQGTLAVPGNLRLFAGQIYPVSAGQFTISAFDYRPPVNEADPGSPVETRPGTITITAAGDRPLPLSAGGELNIYASRIVQGGVLRAPLGSINLGWDGTGDARKSTIAGVNSAPGGPLTAASLPVSDRVVLRPGSEISVSGIDARTGAELTIPFGLVTNSDSWVDPRGIDITVGGVPGKSVSISANRLNLRRGAAIDIGGGGNLYAYRWVQGQGGTQDLLADPDTFAVLPGYNFGYAPFAPFNQSDDAQSTLDPSGAGTVPGYTNSGLRAGDRVYLADSATLPAGSYTLLPARYALLPGAVLVTPRSEVPTGATRQADGAEFVSGFTYNDLADDRSRPTVRSGFEVASAAVFRQRAEYENFGANSYLRRSARDVEAEVPRLPMDSGRLVFQAQANMRLDGTVRSSPKPGGIGAAIDISSASDILIVGQDQGDRRPPKQTTVLNAATLSGFGAESLFIGGVRRDGEDGAGARVVTGRITLDNREAALGGPEVILAARDTLELRRGARVEQSGEMSGAAERLILEGDGALLRLSSDPQAAVFRTGRTAASDAVLTIGDGVNLTGTSLTLDSTAVTNLSARASFDADYVALSSGRIAIRLGNPGELPADAGLVLGGRVLQDLQGVQGLSLQSYTTLDLYGAGTLAIDGDLALHAAQIRGFNQGDREVRFQANHIALDNAAQGTAETRTTTTEGQLSFRADVVEIGRGKVDLDQFAAVNFVASQALRFTDAGRVRVQNNLNVRTPFILSENSSANKILAGGDVRLMGASESLVPPVTAGLGSTLLIQGASLVASSSVLYPSGLVTLRATDGNVIVGGRVDVGGSVQQVFDRTIYTDAGQVVLSALEGSISVRKGAVVSVAAQKNGGDAGTLSVLTPNGDFDLAGTLLGQGGEGGASGQFVLDINRAGRLAALSAALDQAEFFGRRTIRVRTGDVVLGGVTTTRQFDLSADAGSITVTGKVDASGATGGRIRLQAYGDLTVSAGAELTVAGQRFDAAGKGGSILLEAGASRDGAVGTGELGIRDGSVLDLSVAAKTAGSAVDGKFSGILHLRAPRLANNTDVQVAAVDGSIRGASHIIVEGYRIYQVTGTGEGSGSITTALRNTMRTDATNFLGSDGTESAGYATMLARLLGSKNQGLESLLSIRAGIEVSNRIGNITLGAQNSTASNDWNLGSWRFGPKSAPGILTMRAAGDIVLFNAIQDGFAVDETRPALAFLAELLAPNEKLPLNAQAWSYRFTAGADVRAADFAQTLNAGQLGGRGSLRLGKFVTRGGTSSNTGSTAVIMSAILGVSTTSSNPEDVSANTARNAQTRYQVIRTGSGDIEINAGRDVQLLNQFATIYTAGTRVKDPTLDGRFDLPLLDGSNPSGSTLGNLQQEPSYAVQYSLGGGSVSISAANDIAHYIRQIDGTLIEDSSRQMPTNWLYRRGYVDPTTGQFGASTQGETASTTWWVDFSNFFEGIGALGGGHVSLLAGRDVKNVDAVVPSNARMPKGTPDDSKLVELGGGDLQVRAGRDINAGAYYVERGSGTLIAGRNIVTNATRTPSLGILANQAPLNEQTWLPTTLFLGKGSYDVSARGDVLMGPVANPFLLPAGYNNIFRYKTYFSTYAPTNTVDVSSLGGSVTLRTGASIDGATRSVLYYWYENVLLFNPTLGSAVQTASNSQPWLRLNETSVRAFDTVTKLLPATLRVDAPSGDILLAGDLLLAPAARGTLSLAAGGSIYGLQPNGLGASEFRAWYSSRINISDANPAAAPQISSPFAFQSLVGNEAQMRSSSATALDAINILFEETGSLNAVLETKQALHGAGLHADDPEPIRLYAGEGDISGLTLFAPKRTNLFAGKDIIDIALYGQHLSATDVTTVAAGRNLIPYSANSPLRAQALAEGNLISGDANPQAGDLQIGGLGLLEVLAGRDLDLGTGSSNSDGTGTGIVTIGNRRNPYLPFTGADIVAAAGLGPNTGLGESRVDFDNFIDEYILGGDGLALLDSTTGDGTESEPLDEAAFEALTPAQQRVIAMQVFFRLLRDAGRGYGDPESPGYRSYDSGFAAIESLFGGSTWRGDILARGRDIRTRNGGAISLFAPGGGIRLASNVIGNPEVPPGIITETGGDISLFTHEDVDIGVGRIFTLRGGDMIIWSSTGDIAAGSASKTVASAPPTRVIIDPQSADVATDLAGLSTGGGIGVLATVAGVPPGDVDLIAPVGVVDAGDAGIRVSGNLNIAATAVLNASNIAVAGSSAGVPTSAPPPSAPVTAPANSSSTAATNQAANEISSQARTQPSTDNTPSVISVEVVGYGGGESDAAPAPRSRDDEDDNLRASGANPPGPQG